jgi:hypothetical protein
MTNFINCQCGRLHGTVETTEGSLVRGTDGTKGIKFQFIYQVAGKFILDSKNNPRCPECGQSALTANEWESADRA